MAWDSVRVPLFPLPDIVLFPQMRLPLHVFEPRYRRLVRDAMAGDGLIAIPRLRPGFADEYYESPEVFPVFGVGRITRHRPLADGRCDIVVEGVARVRLEQELSERPYRVARVSRLSERVPDNPATVTALRSELSSLVRRLLPYLAEPDERLEAITDTPATAGECADAFAAIVVSDPDQRQRLLEELDPTERLALLVSRLHELLTLAGAEPETPEQLN